jgi:[histone H3]-lysine36 N-dimethyltransferase SETMAR
MADLIHLEKPQLTAELQLETIRHHPYLPDLAPTDFHFFRDLDNYLRDKKLSSQAAVQNVFTQFVLS